MALASSLWTEFVRLGFVRLAIAAKVIDVLLLHPHIAERLVRFGYLLESFRGISGFVFVGVCRKRKFPVSSAESSEINACVQKLDERMERTQMKGEVWCTF